MTAAGGTPGFETGAAMPHVDAIVFEFTLTETMHVEYAEAMQRTNWPAVWKPMVAILVSVLLLLAYFGARAAGPAGGSGAYLAIFVSGALSVVALGALFILWMTMPGRVAKQVRQTLPKELKDRGSGVRIGEVRVWADAEGTGWDDGIRRSTDAWRGITSVLESRHLILLPIDRSRAYIYPRDCFDSREAADRFVEQARAMMAAIEGEIGKATLLS